MYHTLIVDDREIFLSELKRLKVWGEISGFEITGKANNGKQALELLQTKSFDLVLTDIRMPVIDGLQLLREIKKENLCSCVVFLSEHSEFHYARQGIVLGAFDYLVKPVSEEDLLELLKRATSHLAANQLDPNNALSFTDEKYDWAYPSTEEKAIISYIINNDITAIQLFKTTLDNLYIVLKDNIIKADIIIKKAYHNIITTVYEEYIWLKHYINPTFFSEIDFLHDGNNDAYKELYCRKINYLVNHITKLHPVTVDQNIQDICEYILNNPEGDLKLKVTSEKFFLNNTYLSNIFCTKTGIHYNDYITLIKMTRAEYLLRNTNLKPYEIGYQVGYRDTNYFLKQFKNINGQNATKYRNSDDTDFQI